MSKQNEILIPKEFDQKYLKCQNSRENKYGGKIIPTEYKDPNLGVKKYLQLPKMNCPFGVNSFTGDNDNDNDNKGENKKASYSIETAFDNVDPDKLNASQKKIYKEIESLDNRFMKEALEHHEDWGIDIDTDEDEALNIKILQKFYQPQLKSSKDKKTKKPDNKYPKRLKFKVQQSYTNPSIFFMEIYNKDGELVYSGKNPIPNQKSPFELIPKQCKVIVIAKLPNGWQTQGKYGLTWVVEQVYVFPPDKLTGHSLRQVSDDEEEEGENELENVGEEGSEEEEEEEVEESGSENDEDFE